MAGLGSGEAATITEKTNGFHGFLQNWLFINLEFACGPLIFFIVR
jgi:hypothetical protein